MPAAGLGLLRVPLLTGSAADETTSDPVNCLGRQAIAIYVKRSASITGVVTIEEADFNPSNESTYGGTWDVITTLDVSTMSTDTETIHLPIAAYSQIRTRISTVIAGGTVSTVLVGV